MSNDHFQPRAEHNPAQQPKQSYPQQLQPPEASVQQPAPESHQSAYPPPQPQQFQGYTPGQQPELNAQQPAVAQQPHTYGQPFSHQPHQPHGYAPNTQAIPAQPGMPGQQGIPSQQWAPAQHGYVPGALPPAMSGALPPAMPGYAAGMPRYTGAPKPQKPAAKKSHKGLIIGLVTAGVVLVVALLVFFLVLKPMWFGAAGNQEFVTGLEKQPTVKHIDHSGAISSTSTGSDGVVVYSSVDEVWAVNAFTNKELWRTSGEDLGCKEGLFMKTDRSSSSEYVLFLCGSKTGVININTGDRLGDFIYDSNAIEFSDTGMMFVLYDGELKAYADPTRSKLLWERGDIIDRCFTLYNHCLQCDGNYFLDMNTGESIEWLEDISSELRLDSDDVADRKGYIDSVSNGNFLIFDEENDKLELRNPNGKLIWSKEDIDGLFHLDSRYIFVSVSGKTKALDTDTGNEASFKIPKKSSTYAPWEHGVIYVEEHPVYGELGELWELDSLTAYTPESQAWSLDMSNVRTLHRNGSYIYTFSDDLFIIDGVLVNE